MPPGRRTLTDASPPLWDVEDLIKQASVLLTITDPLSHHRQQVTGFFINVDLIASCAHGFSDVLNRCRRLQLDEPSGFKRDPSTRQLYTNKEAINNVKGYDADKDNEIKAIYRYSRDESGRHVNEFYSEEEFFKLKFKIEFNDILLEIPINCFFDIQENTVFNDKDLSCFVYYNPHQDCAILQLPAQNAQWNVEPLRLGRGWKMDELLWICGFPESTSGSKIILPGHVGEVSAEIEVVAKNNNYKISGYFYFHSDRSTHDTNLWGLSGSPVMTEDGYCIGIQVRRIPTGSSAGSVLDSLIAAPAYSIHQMMEHRIHLEYRPSVYKTALSALHEHNAHNRISLKTMIITHQSDRRFAYKLRSYLLAISRARPNLTFDFFSELSNSDGNHEKSFEENCMKAEIIIIALSARGHQAADTHFRSLLEHALRAHHNNGTLLLRLDVTRNHHWPKPILHASFDMSELRAISDYSVAEQEPSMARVALRIRRFLDRDGSTA